MKATSTSFIVIPYFILLQSLSGPGSTSAFTLAPTSAILPTSSASKLPTSSSRLSPTSTLFATVQDYDEQIESFISTLNTAAETKAEDPELVLGALEGLEKLMRAKRKEDKTQEVAQDVLDNLNGSWRLIFTTGTKKTQERFETKINYFPIKAVQSFDTSSVPFKIENGIYAGDFALLKFGGEFEFDLKKSKLEFNFDQISILQLPTINLKKDEAAKIGASTGLGSDSNVKNAQKDKKAFFNWISADETIATARGGGGGLALWKRIE
mmetsp:Transcript_37/g.53  ORF Transcript_37/g.53 Transcript_37/m.53 type:complete len:267 (+) Transcript_37:71-871(+)|eukprot:CAMPEP_0203671672 /NCGR_PEP_ID=MMETSP0090-20130426/7380_1 /ASSEMBLY_ACC=CAM_ASM_001088 /TAXON_ID=426623 /ORGANISM="Chaetoceros affinis, Strain CCMP159" /LENGTH=266 /DNA_ID=CAMNT_0050536787 /DNA_START=45 /DNA_END=845 /DNA_ORIENTATION=+